METVVQFLRRGDVFLARGQRHTIKHVIRVAPDQGVWVIGERADGQYFEALMDWGEVVDTTDPERVPGMLVVADLFNDRSL